MKKILSFLVIMMMAMTAWADAITAVAPTEGDGSSSNPYKIGTSGNLVWFAEHVNDGQQYICGKLTADIDLGNDQTMIGIDSEHKYKGTFDGDGHTITINYTGTENTTALFRYVYDATIKNLRTAGTITTEYKGAGGIVSTGGGETFIENCVSSVTIKSTFKEPKVARHGGIIATNDFHVHLINVLFNGKLLGENATNCSGLVCSTGYTTYITDSWFNPSEVTVSSTESYTLTKEPCFITNSYYSTALGETQGIATTAETLASGEVCYNLNAGKTDGSQLLYQNLDNDKTPDAAPVLDNTHGTVYSGVEQCPTTAYSNKLKAHTFVSYDDNGLSHCTVSGCEGIGYQPAEKNTSDTYLIANKGNLIWFANQVNAGHRYINGKLTANIDLGDYQGMIGTSASKYAGTFDGDGHTVTINYTATEDNTGLFRYVNDATIKNLRTAGSITTGYMYAGGIVSESYGTTNIEHCASSVAITSTFTTTTPAIHGGIVGNNLATANLTNVLFNGKLLGESATNCGGLVGWSQIGANINGCWFNPSEVTVSTIGSETMSRGNDVKVNNSYYSYDLTFKLYTHPQGIATTTETLASGEVCYALNAGKTDGNQAWYQNIDNSKSKDTEPVFDKTHGTVYGGEDQCPVGSFSNTAKLHTLASETVDGVKICTVCHYEAVLIIPETDVSGTYLIANKGDLIWFAQHVNSGNTNINGKLTADIDLGDSKTMIGTSTNKYSGTFDGDGHTVTINYTAAEDNTGLFRYVNDATIKNLRTAGSITTGYMYAGGIVSESYGTTNIEHCASSVTITSTFTISTLAIHGGIVGNNRATANLTNVLFNGKLLGENASNCGGLVGWSNNSANITGCWFNPSEVTVSTIGSETMSRGNCNVSNSYYSFNLTYGNVVPQGIATPSGAPASGELCYALNAGKTNGSQGWYQNLDNGKAKDSAPVLRQSLAQDNIHGTVYGGEDQCPAGSFSNTAKLHTMTIADGVKVCTTCHYEAEYSEPEKDASGTYLIEDKGNFIWFAQHVNSGNTSINGKLTADIDLGDNQTMVGTSTNWYSGTFNGDCHSVTVNYTATEDNTGLFRYVNGATIKNLGTTGSISTGYQFAGGIVAASDGTTSIENCVSSVAITSTFTTKTDGTHGGIVGNNQGTVNLTNVLFNGKLLGESATNCGGLVGWSQIGANINGCWFNPTEVTFNTDGAKTMSRGNDVKVNNSYYSTTLGETQGITTPVGDPASGELCYTLNAGKTDGSQRWYQNIDNEQNIDATPVPFNTHGSVYGGEDQCPIGSYSNTLHGHTFGEWDANGIAHCTNSGCTAVNYQQANQDESGTYLIANNSNLGWFAQYVNKGNTNINGKLIADIDMGSAQAMIGTNKYKYAGTFDGNGYTVTVNYTAAEDVTALFRYVEGGTIKNLMTAGTINTAKRNAAGVAGICFGITLEKVISSVVINSTYKGDATHAGLVAEARSVNSNQTTSSLTDCAFIGQLLGSETTNCAGLVGHHDDGLLTLTNCYVAPSADYTVSTTGSKTLVRNGKPNINNCYYTKTLGDAQGKETIDEVVYGGSLVEKLGNSVWSQDPVLNKPVPFFLKSNLSKYLKFTAQADGTITVVKKGSVVATLEYISEETLQWKDLTYDTPISLTNRENIWLRAKGTNGKNEKLSTGYDNYLTFTSTMDVAASQNIMSLLDASCEQTEVPQFAFQSLFSGWKRLTQAPELPGNVLNSYCYSYMFEGCTGLTSIPDLSDASLANNAQRACEYMFSGCSNLKVNTLGLGSEWKIQMEDTRAESTNNFYSMFSGTGGNFIDKPQKDVTYYIYNDEPYTRSMPYKWGTVALPFDVAYDASNTNHKLYHLTATDSENFTFAEYATGTISAGIPMAVKAIGEKGGDGNYTISIPSAKGHFSGTITAQNSTNAGLPEGWTMNATYTDKNIKAIASNSVYYIAENKFWYAEKEALVPAFRGWFECPSTSQGAKVFNIIIDENDETTSIHNAESIKQNESDAVYNLAGQRVNNSAKGLLIINGKKVYRK